MRSKFQNSSWGKNPHLQLHWNKTAINAHYVEFWLKPRWRWRYNNIQTTERCRTRKLTYIHKYGARQNGSNYCYMHTFLMFHLNVSDQLHKVISICVNSDHMSDHALVIPVTCEQWCDISYDVTLRCRECWLTSLQYGADRVGAKHNGTQEL